MQTPWFLCPPLLNLIHFSEMKSYTAARFEKESRYYVIRLGKDLLDDWGITLINGRIKSKLGQSRTIAFTNFAEGFDHFCAQAKIRYQRGYQIKTIASDNHLLVHLIPFLINTVDKQELPAEKTIKHVTPREQKNRKIASASSNLIPQEIQLGFAF